MFKEFVRILLAITVVLLKVCSCHHGAPLPPHWSLRRASMSGAVLQTQETRNMYQCQRLCWVTSLCVSVTFSTSTRLCSMYTDIPGDSDIILSRTDITSSATRLADTAWKGPCRYHTCEDGTACAASVNNRLCLLASVSCGAPSSVANADVMYSSTTYNATVTYSCRTGYTFQGTSQSAVCSGDASWEGFHGQCVIVSCGDPFTLPDADVTSTTVTFSSTAVYSCDKGYGFVGTSQEAVCAGDGQWRGFNGSCQISSCGTPPDIANADMTYTTMTYNSTVTYSCHTGYNFQGTSQMSLCHEDGQWTGFSGFCDIVSCGTPTTLAYADVTYTAMTCNSTALYNCITGYVFQGTNQEDLCTEDGSWTGLNGSCLPVSCDTPVPPDNADVTYTTVTYNSTAVYSCHTGYGFVGTSQDIVCAEDGLWAGLSGICQIISCDEPGNISNADVTYTSMTYNSTATYICHPGYNFQGASQGAVCAEDGQWTGLSGQCDIADCVVPSPINNADVTYTAMTYNSTAVYTCNTGYTFQGTSQQAVCAEDGKWTGFNGTCLIVSCGTPATVANADVVGATLTYNSSVTYSCQTGYNFQGTSQESVCAEDGLWTGFSGSCIMVSCGTPPDIDNAETTYTALTYNSTAVYGCHTGYNFNGASQEALCAEDGNWTGLNGQCDIVSCSTPGIVANGVSSHTTVTYNSIASYTCDTGYHFENVGAVSTITCQANGQWSPLPGGCVNIKDCADILAADGSAPDGTYIIRPTVGTETINVYCDMTQHGGGWTVFQRRSDGSVDFWRTWAEYRDGFGSPTQEFWLGNTAIYRITNQQTYQIRFDLTDFSNDNAHALYSSFYIENASNDFRLRVSGYSNSGNAGDSFEWYHDGMYFSTKDNDNDQSTNNCGYKMPGGWWYKKCLYSNLNGQYGNTEYSKGVNWESWRGYYTSLKATVMKVRPQ